MNRPITLSVLAFLGVLPLAGCGTSSVLSGLGSSTVDTTYEEQFKQIDAGRDQRITFAETREWLAQQFKAADANKDGFMTESEVPAGYLTGGRDAKTFLAGYDANADRKLSLEEVGVHVNVLFQRDQDANGELTLAEVNIRPKRGGGGETTNSAVPGTSAPGGGAH